MRLFFNKRTTKNSINYLYLHNISFRVSKSLWLTNNTQRTTLHIVKEHHCACKAKLTLHRTQTTYNR